jgi:hypothetical protein
MSRKSHHVVLNPRGRWSVRTPGAVRAERVFATKEAAVRYARVLAKREGSEVYVHRRDGAIETVDSYGSERTYAKKR